MRVDLGSSLNPAPLQPFSGSGMGAAVFGGGSIVTVVTETLVGEVTADSSTSTLVDRSAEL